MQITAFLHSISSEIGIFLVLNRIFLIEKLRNCGINKKNSWKFGESLKALSESQGRFLGGLNVELLMVASSPNGSVQKKATPLQFGAWGCDYFKILDFIASSFAFYFISAPFGPPCRPTPAGICVSVGGVWVAWKNVTMSIATVKGVRVGSRRARQRGTYCEQI